MKCRLYTDREKGYMRAAIVLCIFIITVLWYTILKRSTIYEIPQFEIFWSYRKWLSGEKAYGIEIIGNILMFMPLGFLLNDLFIYRSYEKVRRWVLIVILAVFFSLGIEILQCVMVRGLAEVDDLISNTLGAIFGLLTFEILKNLEREKHFRIGCAIIETAFAVTCLVVYFVGRKDVLYEADYSSKAFCFQIDEVHREDNKIFLTGFAFGYNRHPSSPYMLLRQIDTGEESELAVTYGSPRPDVNSYFLCDYDYTNVGFTAVGDAKPNVEYEVMVRWPRSMMTSAGVFITGENVHYVKSGCMDEGMFFKEPELTSDFVKDGILLLYRPDYSLWVYQYDGELYWVADDGFEFEKNEKTYIGYELSTTQKGKLPKQRHKHKRNVDDRSCFFEEYEIYGDFGKYRVMKRTLPTEYSITSISTGSFKGKEWGWRSYFRPVYE